MDFTGVIILTNSGKVGIIGNSCKKGSWEMNAILLYLKCLNMNVDPFWF